MNHHTFRATVAGGFAAASVAIAVLTLATPTVTAAVATTSQPEVSTATPAASPQGFIMGDGRICNPRWGC